MAKNTLKRSYFITVIGIIPIVLLILYICNPVLRGTKFIPDQQWRRGAFSLQTSLRKTPSRNVIVVTVHRSGSTWFGNLLKTTPDSFYLYEPLNYINQLPRIGTFLEMTKDDTVPFLKGLFQCDIEEDFANFVQSWEDGYEPTKECVKKCLRRENCIRRCYSSSRIMDHCQRSYYRIFKVVRLPLSYVEEFLTTAEFSDLKVIYLIRDPRGTMKSLSQLEQLRNWTLTPEKLCPRMEKDVLAYTHLVKKFPDNLIKIKYEDLAQNPIDISEEIWRFLQNNSLARLPREWKIFARNIYNNLPKDASYEDPFDTRHKSPSNWQKWRQEISDEVLQRTETNCNKVISAFGFRHFDSLSEARNCSISVFDEE